MKVPPRPSNSAVTDYKEISVESPFGPQGRTLLHVFPQVGTGSEQALLIPSGILLQPQGQ